MDRDPNIGRTLGDFRIDELLGRGSMGVVYKARQLSLERPAAVKILPLDFTYDESFIRRFQREAKILAKFQHPNIVNVYASGNESRTYYLVMEFLKGKTLGEYLESKGHLPIEEAIFVLENILRGLGHAHRAGIIHRDLKPANVMITEDFGVKVLDFGLAKSDSANLKMTQTGARVGTPLYMSPEQWRAKSSDKRSDIYSLGVVFFEMLSGARPREGMTYNDLLLSVLSGERSSLSDKMPEVPSVLEAIVNKMIADNADNRYQDTESVLLDLKAYQRGEPVRAAEGANQIDSRFRDEIVSMGVQGDPVVASTQSASGRLGAVISEGATALIEGPVAVLRGIVTLSRALVHTATESAWLWALAVFLGAFSFIYFLVYAPTKSFWEITSYQQSMTLDVLNKGYNLPKIERAFLLSVDEFVELINVLSAAELAQPDSADAGTSFRIPDVNGSHQKFGLEPGDRILEIDGSGFAGVESFRSHLELAEERVKSNGTNGLKPFSMRIVAVDIRDTKLRYLSYSEVSR